MSILARALGFLHSLLATMLRRRAKAVGARLAPIQGRLRIVPPGTATAGVGRRGGNRLLTLPRLSEPEMPSRVPSARGAERFMQVLKKRRGQVIPFPPASRRQTRPAPAADEPRGEILLFMGVRYERQPEPGPEPSPSLSSGQPAGRRRRRQ